MINTFAIFILPFCCARLALKNVISDFAALSNPGHTSVIRIYSEKQGDPDICYIDETGSKILLTKRNYFAYI